MSISGNITAKAVKIDEEAKDFEDGKIPDTLIANEVRDKALLAILGGSTSQAWIDYMSLFKEDATELARLIPTDQTTDGVRQKARAYLVTNGMCGMGSTRHILDNVDKKLDL